MKRNTSDIYIDCLEDIYNNGMETNPRGLDIKEHINFKFQIDNPLMLGYDLEGRKFNWKYLAAELLWYLDGDLHSDFIGKYASLWNRIADKNGKVNSNYGYIVFHKALKDWKNQYEFVLETLKKDKDSRQAIIRYNSDEHAFEGNKDFVCTIANQFFIRKNQIDIIVTMRSNDMFYGFAYDLPWFGFLLQSLYLDLRDEGELDLGTLHWNTGSAHIYGDMFEKTKQVIGTKNAVDYILRLKKSLYSFVKLPFEESEKIGKDFEKCESQDDYRNFLEKYFITVEEYAR